jgi:hypothetical protein
VQQRTVYFLLVCPQSRCVCVCVLLTLYAVSFLLHPIPLTKHSLLAHNHQLLGPVADCESPIDHVTGRPCPYDSDPAST